MNRSAADPIADAVLYEGYILYPYRPAVKNRQRWTFGGLFPEAYCRANVGESSANQTECLVTGDADTVVESAVRFLHLTSRTVAAADSSAADRQDGDRPFRPVETLRVGDQMYHTWQEAEEREVDLGDVSLGTLVQGTETTAFSFPVGRSVESVTSPSGEIVGVIERERRAVEGTVERRAEEVADGLYRVTLRVTNRTRDRASSGLDRDAALLRSLASVHALLGVRGGEFVSLIDPPEHWRDAASACRNVGTWPVLVGEEGSKDTVLSSPIILYDYPRVAPESPGDFFDGTEMDEMLTLRILTMTDEEKLAMAAVDGRTADLLARTETAARDSLSSLHGTIRSFRPVVEGGPHG
jgi:hypothetical protein